MKHSEHKLGNKGIFSILNCERASPWGAVNTQYMNCLQFFQKTSISIYYTFKDRQSLCSEILQLQTAAFWENTQINALLYNQTILNIFSLASAASFRTKILSPMNLALPCLVIFPVQIITDINITAFYLHPSPPPKKPLKMISSPINTYNLKSPFIASNNFSRSPF